MSKPIKIPRGGDNLNIPKDCISYQYNQKEGRRKNLSVEFYFRLTNHKLIKIYFDVYIYPFGSEEDNNFNVKVQEYLHSGYHPVFYGSSEVIDSNFDFLTDEIDYENFPYDDICEQILNTFYKGEV